MRPSQGPEDGVWTALSVAILLGLLFWLLIGAGPAW